MSTIDAKQFQKEIQYNLNLLQSTVEKGIAPDLGFIEILMNDIESLKGSLSDNKIQVLQSTLFATADKMTNASEGVFRSGRPRMGEQKSLTEIAGEYTNGDVKAGLEKLAPNYDIRRIKGDGHCFFRSTMAQYLFAVSNEDDVEQILKTQEDAVKALNNDHLMGEFNFLKEVIKEIQLEEKPVGVVLNNPETSDRLVSYLRSLSVAYNRANQTETFQNYATVIDDSVDKYLADMADMSQAMHGGQPEIIALANCLGSRLHVLDCHPIGKNNQSIDGIYYGEDSAPFTLHLLRRPGHYDMAIPK